MVRIEKGVAFFILNAILVLAAGGAWSADLSPRSQETAVQPLHAEQAVSTPARSTTQNAHYDFGSIAPRTYINVFVTVGDNARQITVRIENSSGDIDLYLRPLSAFTAGSQAELESQSTARSDGPGWEETVTVTAPPSSCLIPGKWYAAVLNLNDAAAQGRVSFTVTYDEQCPKPAVTTGTPTNVTSSSARLNGSVNPNGSDTTYSFQYGTSTAYGKETGAQAIGSGSTAQQVNAGIFLLNPATTYHYRLKATNACGTSYGQDKTFTTAQSATAPPQPSPSSSHKLYYPHLDSTGKWSTELCAVNVTGQNVAGTFKLYGDNGDLLFSKPVTLSAHGRYVADVKKNWGRSLRGYAVFESGSDQIVGYTKFFTQGLYRAAVPAVQEANINTGTLFASHIHSDHVWWTGLSLVNTTGAPKTVTLTFDTGQVRTLTIPAHGHDAFLISQLFGDSSQPNIHSAVITGTSGIIGLELFGGDMLLSGVLLKDDTAFELCFPYIAGGNDWTGFVAYNTGAGAAKLTVTPYTAAGTALEKKSATIPAGSKYVGFPADLGIPAEASWFHVHADQPLTGFQLTGSNNNVRLGGFTTTNNLSPVGIFPCTGDSGAAYIYLVNTTATPATVSLSARSDNGAELATAEWDIAPHGLLVRAPDKLFATGLGQATYIQYAADASLSGYQLNVSADGTLQDGLPSAHLQGIPGAVVTQGAGNTFLEVAVPGGQGSAVFHGTGTITDYTVYGGTGEDDVAVVLNGQEQAVSTRIGSVVIDVSYAPNGSGAYTVKSGGLTVADGTIPAVVLRVDQNKETRYQDWLLHNAEFEWRVLHTCRRTIKGDMDPDHPFVRHMEQNTEVRALAAALTQEAKVLYVFSCLAYGCGKDADCWAAFIRTQQLLRQHIQLMQLVLEGIIEEAWSEFEPEAPVGDMLVYKTIDAGGTRALWVHDLDSGQKWMVPGTLDVNLTIVGLSRTGVLVLFDRAGAFTGEKDRVLVSTNYGRNTPVDLTPSFNLYSSSKLYPREVDVDALGRIYFCGSVKDSKKGIYRINADGTGLMLLPIDVNDDGARQNFDSNFVSVTPDGSMVAFSHTWDGGWLTIANVSGSLWNIRLLQTGVQEALISPRGKYVAFDADYYGNGQLKLVQAPDGLVIDLNRPHLDPDTVAFSPDETYLGAMAPNLSLPEFKSPHRFHIAGRQYTPYSIPELNVAGMKAKLGFGVKGRLYFSGGNYQASARSDIYQWQPYGDTKMVNLTNTHHLSEYDLEVMKR